MDEKPYFINNEGFEWYLDHIINSKIPKSLKMKAFIVKKAGNLFSRVLVDNNQNIIYETPKLEEMGCKVEWLKLAKKCRKF